MGDQLEQTVKVIGELRELLVEGRTLLKDLKQERKRVERVLREIDGFDMSTRAGELLDQEIVEQIGPALAATKQVLVDFQHKSYKSIQDAFDRMARTLMYGNSQGRGISLAAEIEKILNNREQD